MKIAIGTDDDKTISDRYFGQSRYFKVLEFLNGELVSQERRDNPFAEKVDPGNCPDQTDQIVALLKDCSLSPWILDNSVSEKADHIVTITLLNVKTETII